MGIAANIVLADALATPVNHTFIPVGPDANKGFDMVWEDQSRPSPNGYWRIGLRVTKNYGGAKVAGQPVRVKVVLMEPVLETIAVAASGLTQPPTVAYEPKATTEYVISDRADPQVRKDLRKMNYNLQNDSHVITAVEQFVTAW